MMLVLTGHDLTLPDLLAASRGDTELSLDGAAVARMGQHRAVIDQVIADRVPVYGVTTGLGAKVGEALDGDALAAFSLQTLRGRAQAIGPAENPQITRATMILRANTLLLGTAGAQPAVAAHIVACLNAQITPVVGSIGSVGVADLIPNATLGLALAGEGQMTDGSGKKGPAADMMHAHDIAPLVLGPRDGLALASHACGSTAAATFAADAAGVGFEAAQSAAVLSMAAFGANLGPLRADVLALRPLPGQHIAAHGLRARLADSVLWQPGQARRLQDPLSIRNVAQIHGGVAAALAALRAVLEVEINASSDNPAVLLDTQTVVSNGNYYSAELALALDGVARAFVHLAVAQLARISKLLNPAFSGLPAFLAKPDGGSTGFAPLTKPAEAVLAGLIHAATPGPIWPSISANGVEDCLSGAPQSAASLHQVAAFSAQLTAIELIIAAQALEMREGQIDEHGGHVAGVHAWVRKHAAALTGDRPMGMDIDAIAGAIAAAEMPAIKAAS